jgi:hypothetical protein
MGEDGRAVAFHVFIEPYAGAGLGHDRCEGGLANRKRIAAEIVAIQFDQIECVEEYALVSALVTDEIKRGNAVVIAGDCLAVDDARARAQVRHRLNDQREAVGEIISRTAVEAHPWAIFPGDNPKSIMLISCSHWLPDGSLSVLVGRHGAMNLAGKVRWNWAGVSQAAAFC